MYVPEFSIPLSREELCQAREDGQYYVKYLYSPKELQERLEDAKSAALEEGPSFIVDHFPTFYSLLQNFNQTTELNRHKALSVMSNSLVELTGTLTSVLDDIKNQLEIKNNMRNITKMTCYILVELMISFQDKYIDNINVLLNCKTKKKQKTVDCNDWVEDKLKVLKNISLFLELPVKMLWDPPVVDEEFVNLIANFCYKCLEDSNISNPNMKMSREMIFQIIGCLIKNYLHGLSFCVKVVQLLKSYEHVVIPLAKGTMQVIEQYKCTNIVKEIVREISETDGEQLVADSSGTRSLNMFLVQLAEAIPETIIPAIDLLIHHLAGDSYTMRMCVLEVLGEIVLTILSKENLAEELKTMRDEFLDCLEDHVHDVNAFVRSKALQIWQKLCSLNSIPISRLNHLLELTIGRLNDKSTYVKKRAILLIKDLLERNPYSAQLNATEIRIQMKEEAEKIDRLKKTYRVEVIDADSEWEVIKSKLEHAVEKLGVNSETFAGKGVDGDLNMEEKIQEIADSLMGREYETAVDQLASLKDKCNALFNLEAEDVDMVVLLRNIFYQKVNTFLVSLPVEVQEMLNKYRATMEYLGNALKFAELIDQALPIILTLLDSNVITDVLESISFFTAAYLFGFQQALEGVRKMLYLMYSKEDGIKLAVSEAYKNIYFDKDSKGRQHSLTTMKNLSDLILKLNESQLNALEIVVGKWMQAGLIDNNFIQVMFERFSKKITNTSEASSWSALVLIRMVGSQEPRIIKSNIAVILSQGLCNPENQNLLIAKEACRALSKLIPERQHGKTVDETFRYSLDHEIFMMLGKFLRDGLWRTNDPYYIPMAEEAINLVYQLSNQPDKFSERLINEIYERIVNDVDPLERRKGNTGKILKQSNQFDELLNEHEPEYTIHKDEKESEGVSDKDIIIFTRFISVLGQIAANYILFLEGPVLNELKRRNQVDYERKLKRFQEKNNKNLKMRKSLKSVGNDRLDKSEPEVGEDLDFNRVAADDMDSEEMKKKTEHEIVLGSGYFAKFTPFVLTICKNPAKYDNTSLQNAAVLTLSKLMLVSSVFCEENLQLLVTICEKSHCPLRRKNAIIALGALQYRFPNTLEPWTQHMYGILRDPDSNVRLTAVLVLTDLIVNEMIKVRSNISDLALCIVDKDPPIAKTVRHFFREYSQKGNSLFNVLPCLMSDLIRPGSDLTEDEFKTIMKFIIGLITKDKQSEYLIDKLFQYFESATTERQWKDISFCLSLLNYNEKGLKKILDNLRFFGNKLYLADVYEAFCTIVTNASKNPQKDKSLLKEIQCLIKECRDKSCQDKNVILSVQTRKTNALSCGKSASKRVVVSRLPNKENRARKQLIKEEEMKGQAEDDGEDYDVDDDDDDAFLSDVSIKKSLKIRTGSKYKVVVKDNALSDNDSENGDCPKKQMKNVRTRSCAKKIKIKGKYADDTSEEEEKQERVICNRKRK